MKRDERRKKMKRKNERERLWPNKRINCPVIGTQWHGEWERGRYFRMNWWWEMSLDYCKEEMKLWGDTKIGWIQIEQWMQLCLLWKRNEGTKGGLCLYWIDISWEEWMRRKEGEKGWDHKHIQRERERGGNSHWPFHCPLSLSDPSLSPWRKWVERGKSVWSEKRKVKKQERECKERDEGVLDLPFVHQDWRKDSTMKDEGGKGRLLEREGEGVLVSTLSGRKERSNDEIELDMKKEEENDKCRFWFEWLKVERRRLREEGKWGGMDEKRDESVNKVDCSADYEGIKERERD